MVAPELLIDVSMTKGKILPAERRAVKCVQTSIVADETTANAVMSSFSNDTWYVCMYVQWAGMYRGRNLA